MRVNTRWCLASAAALLGLWGGALLLAAAPDKPDRQDKPAEAPSADKIKPHWKPGQKWEVETLSQLVQYGNPLRGQAKPKPVLWEFTVLEPQKVAGTSCLRIRVEAKTGNRRQALTMLWLDEKSLALRQVQTQLRVQGGVREVTESYLTESGQPCPVMTPLTAIPLDMPVFLADSKAGAQKFTYETISGPEGKKDPTDVGFAYEIEQQVELPKEEAVKGLQSKGLLTESFTKDLESKPLVEVRLKTAGRRVQQMWQAGLPWPAYSSNGVTQARLVRVLSSQP